MESAADTLRGVVAPLVETSALDPALDHLIALVDGLGLRIARDPSSDVLAASRRACEATLLLHLEGLVVQGASS